MRGVFEKLVEVSQDEEIPDGLAETAEDLVSAGVMNHPVRDMHSMTDTICKVKEGARRRKRRMHLTSPVRVFVFEGEHLLT